jgi:hypothetical protein
MLKMALIIYIILLAMFIVTFIVRNADKNYQKVLKNKMFLLSLLFIATLIVEYIKPFSNIAIGVFIIIVAIFFVTDIIMVIMDTKSTSHAYSIYKAKEISPLFSTGYILIVMMLLIQLFLL